MAKKRYDNTKGVSLGAFAQRYIFGRIYRSLLGTKNLQYYKKIVLMELPENISDKKKNLDEYMFELLDLILCKYNPVEIDIINMVLQNFKKSEIIRTFKVNSEYYDALLEDFKNNFVI